MGSSNMNVMTTGDIEAQRHNPNWLVDHKHMLRPNQEDEGNKLGYFILKVPECRRQPPNDFSPRGWQFGLHNREKVDSIGSEAVKLGIAVLYGLVGEKWDHFCDAIVDDPKAMLACYDLQNGVTSWTDEQIKHILALDALFLADYIERDFPENERQLWPCIVSPPNDVFNARYEAWRPIVGGDLYLVENQIPFVLIDKVVKYISNSVASQTSEGNINHIIDDLQYQQRRVEYVVDRVCKYFMVTSGEAFKIENSSLSNEKTHILGAMYKTICGSKGLLMTQSKQRSEYIRIPSATKLVESGIKLSGVNGPLCTMSYTNQCLSLPKMKIYEEMLSFIRNMAWYEMSNILGGCLFHDYIFTMTDLIQTPKDLDLLIKCGVIHNSCGVIKGFEMWTTLEDSLIEINSSQAHRDMKEDIVKRCDLQRYRLWSEFKIVFCSKPWLVLSTIAVVLVTMATLVQSYTAVVGSNKMKPKFP